MLYIFWFLHQTTTLFQLRLITRCCISFDSYIKPQLSYWICNFGRVVYLLIPTSNHNNICTNQVKSTLYIFWFLHQTTTYQQSCQYAYPLYIFWFLHQTTTIYGSVFSFICCISFDSYIKPQHAPLPLCFRFVVYLLIPTSNHNLWPTELMWLEVVYLLIPTSNHNWSGTVNDDKLLYIFWFLHQTTTFSPVIRGYMCCISFDSYIKPQLRWMGRRKERVVYLLIPTSNHN